MSLYIKLFELKIVPIMLFVAFNCGFCIVDREYCFIFFVFYNTAGDNLTFGYRVTDTFLKFFLVGTREVILSVGTYLRSVYKILRFIYFIKSISILPTEGPCL